MRRNGGRLHTILSDGIKAGRLKRGLPAIVKQMAACKAAHDSALGALQLCRPKIGVPLKDHVYLEGMLADIQDAASEEDRWNAVRNVVDVFYSHMSHAERHAALDELVPTAQQASEWAANASS